MSRKTTFGYDATVSVHGTVVRHIVESLFEDATIPDSFSTSLDDGRRLAVLIESVTGLLEPPLGEAGVRVFIQARLARLLVDGADVVEPEMLGLVTVGIRVAFVRAGDTLRPDFAGITDDDIELPTFPGMAGITAEVKAQIRAVLSGIPPERAAARLSFTGVAGLDSADLVSLPSREGRPTALVAGLYSATARDVSGDNPTRGSVGGLVSILNDPDTLAVRLSSDVFDRTVERSLRARYGHADLVVPRSGVDTDSSGAFSVTAISESTGLGPDEGFVTVSSPGGQHVSAWIQIGTGTMSMSVLSGADGSFSTRVIVAGTGDTVTIRGQRIRRVTPSGFVELPRPSVRLRTGYIEVSGLAMVMIVGIIDFEADYRAELVLEPDPTQMTSLNLRARSSSYDIPWYVDVARPFVEMFEDLPEIHVGRIVTRLLEDRLPDTPVLGGGQHLATFIDGAALAGTHLEVSGSAHYGQIVDAAVLVHNRSRGDFRLPGGLALTVGAGGTTRVSGGLIRALEAGFERLGERDLRLDYSSVRAVGEDVAVGSVFAVERRDPNPTNRNHIKLRLDALTPTPIAKYVEYAAPLVPTVDIVGTVDRDPVTPDVIPRALSSWFSANLRAVLDPRRLHLAGAELRWEVEGDVGTWEVETTNVMDDTVNWSLTAMQLGLHAPTGYLGIGVRLTDEGKELVREYRSSSSRSFHVTFRVSATDVFGRTATATWTLRNEIGYASVQPSDLVAGPAERPAILDPMPPRVHRQWG